MEEKMKEIENDKLNTSEKLSWEAPKLYSLEKGKTEGGEMTSTAETGFYAS